MSHFTRVKTTLMDRATLVAALERMGYDVQEGDVQVRGWAHRHTGVDIKIPSGSANYDIGFRRAGDSYELVADWYGIRNETPEGLLQRITQQYAYCAARRELEAQGFAVTDEVSDNDGTVRLVLRRAI